MSRLPLTLLGLSLVVVACVPVSSTPFATGTQPTQVVVQQPTATRAADPATATSPPATSAAAAASATPVIAEGTCAPAVTLTAADGQITFQGISFRLDPALATSVTAQQCAAVPFRAEDPPGTAHPAGVTFAFSTERKRIDFQPLIAVYRVEDDMRDYLYPLNSLLDLQQLLTRRIEPSPWFDAAPLHVRPQYIDFAQGSGVRGLIQYMQDMFFYTNNGLLYNFDGLTADGRYYVNVRMPAAVSFLLDIENSDPSTNTNPEAISVPDWPNDYSAQLKIIEAYNQEALRCLDQATNAEFDPNLALLDTVVQSVQVAEP